MFGGTEKRILETGLKLYQQMQSEAPSVFKKEFWNGKIMDWCMKNEDFKVQMFRFVDVFPSLTHPQSVTDHIDEYFCRSDLNFSTSIQWGLKLITPGNIGKNITNMARQFITGENIQEALPVLTGLRNQGLAFTADLLGEAVVSENEAEQYFQRYIDLLNALSAAQRNWPALGGGQGDLDWGCSPKINISIKPSAMYSQMNPRGFEHSVSMAKNRLRLIFRRAMQSGAHVILDMEHTALKNITLELYKSLLSEEEFRNYPHTGIVIQAYLKESEADLEELIKWAKKRGQRFTIRLVKGAYWDIETVMAKQHNWPIPVFTRKHKTDANFEKLARLILQNSRHVSLACASHNIRSIAYVIEQARKLKAEGQVEFQVLYGMADSLYKALGKNGLKVRLYTPIGAMIPGMAYLVRRLLENTANESFLRQSFAEKKSIQELLRNPAEIKDSAAPAPPARECPEYGDKGPFRNEPLLDWTIAANRAEFQAALQKVRAETGKKIPLYINGQAVTTSAEIVSTDPNDPGHVIGVVSAAGLAEAEAAITAAKKAFASWRDTDPRERAEYLFRAAAVARAMRRELAALQVYEVGKNWSEADADVTEGIDFLEYYGREIIRLARPRRMGRAPGEVSRMFYEPKGVGAVIAPWNFPFAISVGMTAAALITGNTVVYKPASQSPVVGSKVYEIFVEAKLPSGVLNFLPGPGGKIGDYLVTHPEVAFIAFTGSMEVGLRIVELAGKTPAGASSVKSVVAEMGGKNAVIVDADADLDEAVVHTIYSAFGYQGQKCSACSRVIVLEENYDGFVHRLCEAARSIVIGSPERPETYMGAVIDESAKAKILSFIEQGKKEGRLLVYRDEPEMRGHYVPLCIFEGIRPEHVLAQEEIFGPVLSVIKVKDFNEALEVANGTRYALTGGLFSRSPKNIARAMREFRVGNLYINRGCTGAIVERHPFGGFKMSGLGSKAGGPDYLLEFMVPRVVTENTIRRGFAPSAEGDI